MTKKFRRELFSEFLAPLAIVVAVFSLAAFWPLDGATTQSAVSVEVAMPSALSAHSERAKGVAQQPADKHDRALTTIGGPEAVLRGRS